MSYIGMAANIVGGELQGWAALLERDKMFSEYKDELARQQQYKQEAGVIQQGAVQQQGFEATTKDLAASKAARVAGYAGVNSMPNFGYQSPNQNSWSGAQDKAYSAARGQERANLGSYGDWQLHSTLNDIQNKESLRQVQDFAKGTSQVYPYRAYEAQHSWDDMAMIGAAISSIGGGSVNFAQYNQGPKAGGTSYGTGMNQGGQNNTNNDFGGELMGF